MSRFFVTTIYTFGGSLGAIGFLAGITDDARDASTLMALAFVTLVVGMLIDKEQ